MSAQSTALERAREAAPARATPLDALRVARRMWLADQRLDMGGLASELGVSRATLYNWVGDRERLIGEVLWSFAEHSIERAKAAAAGAGPAYISDVIEGYLSALAAFEPNRQFITRDPELALRVLTGTRTAFQQRLIEAVTALIEEQVSTAGYQPPLDPATLAYVLVRIGESFIFNDVITGLEPDLGKAVQASRVLLFAPRVAETGAR